MIGGDETAADHVRSLGYRVNDQMSIFSAISIASDERRARWRNSKRRTSTAVHDSPATTASNLGSYLPPLAMPTPSESGGDDS